MAPAAPLSATTRVAGDRARRSAIVALSAFGASCMAATSLLQLGFIRDLPDPKLRWFGLPFDSKRVNLSADARVLGLPDGPIAVLGFLANVPLALAGGRDRRTRPAWSLLAAGSALAQALAAGIFFSKMPRRERAWCSYCIASALASTAILVLALPEAASASSRLLRAPRRSDGGDRVPSAEARLRRAAVQL